MVYLYQLRLKSYQLRSPLSDEYANAEKGHNQSSSIHSYVSWGRSD